MYKQKPSRITGGTVGVWATNNKQSLRKTAYSSPKQRKSMSKTALTRHRFGGDGTTHPCNKTSGCRRRRMSGQITKTLLVMKLTTILLTVAVLNVSAKGLSQTVSLKGKNMPLQEVLTAIKTQTGYAIICNFDLLEKATPVNIHAANWPLEQFLQQVLKNQTLDYSIKNTTIVLSPKAIPVMATNPRVPEPGLYNAFVQSVKGRVTGTEGVPLAGATVNIKGTKTIALTNTEGIFNLNLSEGDVIVISFVGYATKETTITLSHLQASAAGGLFSIALTAADSKLDAVQIIAYGTTTRRLSTSNVSQVTAEEIGNQPVANPLTALEGRVPGLLITQTSGVPGAPIKVEIRGRTAIDRTLTDDQPLFLVDGVPMPYNNTNMNQISNAAYGTSPFSTINPEDIESVEVLKDADATAIYGSRGANGVILITTKKGKAGKTRFNVKAYSGFNKATHVMKMANTQQFVAMRKQAFANDNLAMTNANAYDLLLWDTTRYTDIVDLFLGGSGRFTNADLSVAGGNGNTQYSLGGSYSYNSSIMPGHPWQANRSLRLSVNHTSPNQKFKLNFIGGFGANSIAMFTTDFTGSVTLAPNFRFYDDQGNLAWNEDAGIAKKDNPLSYTRQTYESKYSRVNGSLDISYKLLNNLQLRTTLGYSGMFSEEYRKMPLDSYNPSSTTAVRSAAFGSGRSALWTAEPQAEYKTRIARGDLSILAGGSFQSTLVAGSTMSLSGYTSDDLLNSVVGATSITAARSTSQYKYDAVFGRINYDWQHKYIVNLSLRRDASSNFGEAARFANFSAVGAAWVFTNEDWVKDHLPFLSFGKLRGSMGNTGNDKLAAYQYLDTYSAFAYTYTGSTVLYPAKHYNKHYRWEKTRKKEIALELGFWKDRILLNTAYYNHSSSNQLVSYPLPYVTGFSSVFANMPALVRNTGIEVDFQVKPFAGKDFSWTITGNISFPRNELASFPGIETSTYFSKLIVGKPLNIAYTYKATGIDSTTGLFTFEDINGDKTYDYNDYRYAGSLNPQYYGGFSNTVRYKGFELEVFFSFKKQLNRNFLLYQTTPGSVTYNIPERMIGQFWEKPGDNTRFQKLTTTSNSSTGLLTWSRYAASNEAYSDASFIRLKNLACSYSLPKPWLKKMKVDGARLFVQGQNLLTITSYEGNDPESGGAYSPQLKTFTAGIQVNF